VPEQFRLSQFTPVSIAPELPSLARLAHSGKNIRVSADKFIAFGTCRRDDSGLLGRNSRIGRNSANRS